MVFIDTERHRNHSDARPYATKTAHAINTLIEEGVATLVVPSSFQFRNPTISISYPQKKAVASISILSWSPF